MLQRYLHNGNVHLVNQLENISNIYTFEVVKKISTIVHVV